MKVLLLTKATDVQRLKEMGLVGRIFDHPNFVHFSLDEKIRCLVAYSPIEQEDLL